MVIINFDRDCVGRVSQPDRSGGAGSPPRSNRGLACGLLVPVLVIGNFEFVSDFDIRISCLFGSCILVIGHYTGASAVVTAI